jgi:hypothetical protein
VQNVEVSQSNKAFPLCASGHFLTHSRDPAKPSFWRAGYFTNLRYP